MLRFKIFNPILKLYSKYTSNRWRGIRFLCYHDVVAVDDLSTSRQDKFIVTVQEFCSHLEYLQKHKYSVVSMQIALELLESNKAKNGQYICITFDDGKLNSFEYAWPVLREFKYSAHFFITSTFVCKYMVESKDERYIDDNQIVQLIREGASIGSHSKRHLNLTLLDNNAIFNELVKSQEKLEELCGHPIETFAYPFGMYSNRVIKALSKTNYRYAFKLDTGSIISFAREDRYTIPRNVIKNERINHMVNYLTMSGGYDFTKYFFRLD